MDYAGIVSTALAYSDRATSIPVSSNMDNFLRIVESRVNRQLLIMRMSSTVYTPIDTTQLQPFRYALPDDFLAERSIRITQLETPSYSNVLLLVNHEQFSNIQNNVSSLPVYMLISGFIQINPVPVNAVDATYILEINYFKGVPAIISGATNWLSQYYPDIYIFGLMVEINSFVKDAETTAMWDARFQGALSELSNFDNKAVYSGTPITTKVG